MRTILVAMLTAIGVGLMGISGATAMPMNGSALRNAAENISAIDQIRVVVRHVYRHPVVVRHVYRHPVVVRHVYRHPVVVRRVYRHPVVVRRVYRHPVVVRRERR